MSQNPDQNVLATPLHGIYIPAGLLILGTAIVRAEWTLHAIVLTLALAIFKVYRGRASKVLHPREYREFELVEKHSVSAHTTILRFGLPRNSHVLGISPGQHITVCLSDEGHQIERSYTPISTNSDIGYFELLVKQYPNGRMSQRLAGLQVHQTILAKGPHGDFRYTAGMAPNLIMIAGGSGITAMLPVISAIVKNPLDKTRMHLYYASASFDQLILYDELQELASKYPHFEITFCLDNSPGLWPGHTGHITKELIKTHYPDALDPRYFKILICGPPEMRDSLSRACRTLLAPTSDLAALDSVVHVFQ